MKALENKIVGFIVIIVLLGIISFIIFSVVFIFGMINNNSRKSISADIVSECVTDLKNNNKNLIFKNLDLYYKQGALHADMYFENNVSIDESKIVIKSFKEFILKDKTNKYLIANIYSDQLNIKATINCKDNSYYYTCPYYIRTSDNSDVKNNYKVWYLKKSSGETIESMDIS